MDTIEQLREFYTRNGISALDFQCPSQGRCKAAAVRDGGTFTTAREAYVGERHLDSRPRIAVVSLDPGGQFDKAKGRFLQPEEIQLEIRRDRPQKRTLREKTGIGTERTKASPPSYTR